jgi:ubiquinone/menaquinone biosynthesis C-methylase UbiE
MNEVVHSTASDERHSFEWFSREEFYRAINRDLLDRLSLNARQTVLDLGCGDGAISRLISQKAKGINIIAVDQSSDRLAAAKANLAPLTSEISFRVGTAEDLSSIIATNVDAVIFCNAIHMIEDKGAAVAEISKVGTEGSWHNRL